MADLTVRPATINDCDTLWEMLRENREVEGRLEKMTLTYGDFKKDGFGDKKRFDCMLVELTVDGVAKHIGFSMVYFVYSGTVGRSLHIEEIYIKEEYRGKGYGSVLFKHVAKNAITTGCHLMTWGVFNTPWNIKTINFYKKFGAEDHDVHIYSLTEDALKQYQSFDHSTL